MDDAGVYGNSDSIRIYIENLFDKYIIKIIFQVSRTPFSTFLYIGSLMNLYIFVKCQHYPFRQNTNAVVTYVTQTWQELKLDHVVTTVFDCLRHVLCNILEGGGAHYLVKNKCDKNMQT